MRLLVQNFVLFQLGWLCCVLGGAHGYAWLGGFIVTIIVIVHLLNASLIRPEVQLILYVIAIGTMWDSLLTYLGLMEFTSGVFIEGIAPHWLIAMWALFATTLNVSMRWLQDRLWLSILLGLLGGPLAYFAGHRLGAVEFPDMTVSLLVIAIGWAIIMPILSRLARVHDGYPPQMVSA